MEVHADLIYTHAKTILRCMRIEHIQTLLKTFITTMVTSELTMKKQLRESYLLIVLNDLIKD
jgi:hypothetical protein